MLHTEKPLHSTAHFSEHFTFYPQIRNVENLMKRFSETLLLLDSDHRLFYLKDATIAIVTSELRTPSC